MAYKTTVCAALFDKKWTINLCEEISNESNEIMTEQFRMLVNNK